MTSSEPSLAGGGAPVLAHGHLHPGTLFLRLIEALRQSILPIIIAIFAKAPLLAVAAAVFLLLGLVFAVVRYVTFRYRLTTEELITTEGILHRQERRIPVDRIQDLSFESTLLRRMLGLVVVQVETASGTGAEAKLDSLAQRDAARLRDVLFSLRGRAAVESDEDAQPKRVLFRSTGGELTLLGLTNNRIGAVLLAVVGFIELSDELGFGDTVTGAVGGLFERLSSYGQPIVVMVAVGMLFMVVLAGWTLSVAASLVIYHGFVLSERDDVLYRRYGLITTRAQSLPRHKIQRVTIESTPMRRLVGAAAVRADSAGSGARVEGAKRTGSAERDVIVPLTRVRHAELLVPWLLLGIRSEPLEWQRVSSRVVARVFMKSVLLCAGVLALGLPTVGPVALLGLLALPVGYGLGLLAYANLGYARIADHVAFRSGVLGRYRSYVPHRKIQCVTLRAGPVERALRLARVTLYVAGGSPTSLANLPRDEAERLVHAIAEDAARARFVW